MDIPVNAAKPGRRRYLTLVMIFITVVICYVDRANLAVASAHIQEEFGITKAEMGYVFSAFAWLYTLCQIPGGWFLDRVGSRVTYFIAIFLQCLHPVHSFRLPHIGPQRLPLTVPCPCSLTGL